MTVVAMTARRLNEMVRTRRSALLGAFVAVVMLAMSSCANDDGTSSDASGPIVIGGTLGLTGIYSGPSAGYKATYDYWLEQVNAAGGIDGRKVEMKIYDDESDATTAQQIYQRLINDDKVDILLAPYNTAVGGAVVPIADRAGKVLFDAGFLSKELHAKSKLLVTSWPMQEPEASKAFFDYLQSLTSDQRPTKLAIATAQHPFTIVAREGFESEGGVLQYAKDLGIDIVFDEEYDAAATDLTSLVEHAKASGADAFVALSLPNDAALMAKTVNQVGFEPTYYCSCGSQVTTLPNWPELGTGGVNVFGSTNAWATQDNAGIKELSDAMVAQLETPVMPSYAAVGYAILQVIQQAIEGSGTLDQQKLRDFIGENEFDTAVGKLSYHDDGTVEFGALLVQFQKDGNEVIWPEKDATAAAVVPYAS